MSLKSWGRLQSRVGEDYKFYCINNIDRLLDTCGREVAMHEGYVLYIYVLYDCSYEISKKMKVKYYSIKEKAHEPTNSIYFFNL